MRRRAAQRKRIFLRRFPASAPLPDGMMVDTGRFYKCLSGVRDGLVPVDKQQRLFAKVMDHYDALPRSKRDRAKEGRRV